MGTSIPGEALHESVGEFESVEAGRERIDGIDDQLLVLLNERASVAVAIAAVKRRDNLPEFDIVREHQILARLTALNQGPLSDEQVSQLFLILFDTTRSVQKASPEGPGTTETIT
jgi:chorismate mutase/prephenate dehydratase